MTRLTTNPFATRYVSPGMVPWIHAPEQSLEQLRQKFLVEFCGRAAVVGPHGSGKSTLLEHLVPLLGTVIHREAAGKPLPLAPSASGFGDSTEPQLQRPILWISLRRGGRPARRVALSCKAWRRGSLLVIDGFEQLPMLAQWLTRSASRGQGMGLLVTSHARTGLKTLLEPPHPSVTLAQQVVAQACRNADMSIPAELVDRQLLENLLREEKGNLREVLMRLYDIAHQALPR